MNLSVMLAYYYRTSKHLPQLRNPHAAYHADNFTQLETLVESKA